MIGIGFGRCAEGAGIVGAAAAAAPWAGAYQWASKNDLTALRQNGGTSVEW